MHSARSRMGAAMSSLASSSTGPDRQRGAGEGPPGHGLRANAIKARDVVVLSLASSGPTQSIAVTLAALLATIGYASFLPLVICFIPMLGIAIGYQRLNAWQPSAGATYSWVGRAINPHAGFFSGWIMLMYYTIGTTSLTIPLGTYTLSFFSNAAANNKYDVALVGTALNLLVLIVAALGIKLSARFQWAWAIFEYGLLVGFTIAAIVVIYGGSRHHTVHLTSSWFTLSGAGGFSALISGVLLAIFLYSVGHGGLCRRGGARKAGRSCGHHERRAAVRDLLRHHHGVPGNRAESRHAGERGEHP